MAKHARQPTTEETASLTECARSDDAFAGARASVILLSAGGKGTSDIAGIVGLSVRQIRNIIDAFNMQGMQVLKKRKSSGRPRALTDRQREALRELIGRRPRDFGIDRDGWTLQSMGDALVSEGICESISPYTIQREIKRCGIDWSEVKLGGTVRIPPISPDASINGSPVGNRYGVSASGGPPIYCGLYADRMLRLGERELYDEVIKNLRADYAAITNTHTLHLELAAVYYVKLVQAQAEGDWEQAERFDRMMQSHLKELKAAKKKQESEQKYKTGDTPAEWAAEMVEKYRSNGASNGDVDPGLEMSREEMDTLLRESYARWKESRNG
ncbi:MAG: helix-turn-helix domain-containing protein [Armatimonadota bacterium]